MDYERRRGGGDWTNTSVKLKTVRGDYECERHDHYMRREGRML